MNWNALVYNTHTHTHTHTRRVVGGNLLQTQIFHTTLLSSRHTRHA